MKFRTIVLSAAFLAMMLLAVPAMAGYGGGTVVRIDHGPKEFVAGEPTELIYTVLAMGETPLAGASAIELWPAKGTGGPAGGLRFEGTPTKTPGQYLVEVMIPVQGTWLWSATHTRGWTDLGAVEVARPTMLGVLNSDLVALLLAAAVTLALARLISRMKPELGAGVVDHIPDVSPERA